MNYMEKRGPFALAMLIILCSVSLFGCAGSSPAPDPSPTPRPAPTPTPAPTVVPSLLAIGEDGSFEDSYLTTKFPPIIKYDYSPSYNSACYTCIYGNGDMLALMYLPDEDLDFEDEFGNFDSESYARLARDEWGAELIEFGYTSVDGHEALRSVITYSNSAGNEALMLSYMINVNGWALTISVTTTGSEIPPEFEQGILDIEFKSGY